MIYFIVDFCIEALAEKHLASVRAPSLPVIH